MIESNGDASAMYVDANEIRAIQLEALKEGARRAADKVQSHKYCGCNQCENEQMVANRILNTSQNWTEKDL